jgi:hypothetical protein
MSKIVKKLKKVLRKKGRRGLPRACPPTADKQIIRAGFNIRLAREI